MDGGAQWAIEVAGLEKRYGDRRAVDGIDLRIPTGAVFGLLGPNGAGKTSTVETLEGYRKPDGGTVRVLGLDPQHDGPALRGRIGVMLQEGGLYPGVRPLEALHLFAAFYPDPDDPERLLDLVGLREVAGTYVRRLSGGECQRLSLALALVGRPELVFLDEPTAGMDPRARATTWQLVRELRDAGTTVVLTTHHMDEAEHLCDQLAIIDHGRIVLEGTPADITDIGGRDLHFSTTAGLDLPALAAAMSLPAAEVLEERPGEYTIRAAMTPELVADLAVWLRDKGYGLTELRTERATLEEVFLQLTREDGR
ncbi:MAG TPA: ABC transporter ATP-binding protein [Acidimicrobiia bacterium]|jgi:ABC-2 type transport system ATP-binding protein